MVNDDRLLEQTRWAWTNEYGPDRTTALLADIAALRNGPPALSLADAIARVDPENPEKDYEDYCASRW